MLIPNGFPMDGEPHSVLSFPRQGEGPKALRNPLILSIPFRLDSIPSRLSRFNCPLLRSLQQREETQPSPPEPRRTESPVETKSRLGGEKKPEEVGLKSSPLGKLQQEGLYREGRREGVEVRGIEKRERNGRGKVRPTRREERKREGKRRRRNECGR
jgi:hypothetical protein